VTSPPRQDTTDQTAKTRLHALHQRLTAAATALGVDATTRSDEVAGASSEVFGRLVEHVHGRPGTDGMWLLMTAMSGAMPEPDELAAALRARDLSGPDDFSRWLLEAAHQVAWSRGAADLEMDVVTDMVVVEVDFAARHNLHTGIQRVVRETVSRWAGPHELTLVAWTDSGGALRRLADFETNRVVHWGDRMHPPDGTRPEGEERILVPWRCQLVLPENPAPDHSAAIAALASYSGSTVGLIGYDCIPVISPDLIQAQLPDRFMRYLQVVKHAHQVVGISASAAREFRGFVQMLGAQGLQGPAVSECALPVEVPPGASVPQATPPLVVCIGSFEPRKNQVAVLHAAEQLWREGLEFQVEFIGGSGWATEFDGLINRLRGAGRAVRRRTAITDTELWRTLRSARFSVFVSLHEGFGLPVAESLACGTPCLTSDYGSTREIADEGGALVVDPRDDLAIADQMRRLMTDDALLDTLRQEAAGRPPRTWDDYAKELWDALVSTTSEQEAAR